MSENRQTETPGFEWRLREMMARKKIRFALDLHRRLVDAGHKVSRQTVNQWVDEDGGDKIRAPHLVALCKVLDCQLQDLVAMKS